VNSRGREPTEQAENVFDPAGVVLFSPPSSWVATHGYSCLAASRPEFGGSAEMRLPFKIHFNCRIVFIAGIRYTVPHRKA